MISTHQIGTSFENAVAALLACKYEHVEQQVRLKGVNADIVLSYKTNPRRSKRIAVECKNWANSCTKDDLIKILRSYEAALDANEVDEVWVITSKTPAATVRDYADTKKNIELFSIAEIERDIINFNEYLSHLIDDHDTDPLYSYYILPRLADNSQTLHAFITEWIGSGPTTPVAIWAGYGMGKTSYAKYLAAALARQHIEDPTNPIPLLVSLGELYTSPNISSLFRYNFEDRFRVKNYNHRAFEVMNRHRRFVIILDGFDEMKHAMSRAEFDDFSNQIFELTSSSPNLILLGRPDAINSDEEYVFLTDGKSQVGMYQIADQRIAHFNNIRLSFFSVEEYSSFLMLYLARALRTDVGSPEVLARLKQAEAFELEDVVRRPVQAKMLADILVLPENITKLRISTRYELYSAFVDGCIKRELGKRSRRGISADDRREFMRELAWWLWCDKRTRTFTAHDVPVALVRKFVPDVQIDIRSACRELLIGSLAEEQNVGSLLSEKTAGTFYFPHMSFEEFLVADYLVSRDLTSKDVLRLDVALMGEVLSFVEGIEKIDLGKKIFDKLAGLEGSIEVDTLIRLVRSSKSLKKSTPKMAEHTHHAWELLAVSIAVFEKGIPHETHELIKILARYGVTGNPAMSLASLFTLSWYVSHYKDFDSLAVASIVFLILQTLGLWEIYDALKTRGSGTYEPHSRRAGKNPANDRKHNVAVRLYRDHLEFASAAKNSQSMIVLKCRGLMTSLQKELPIDFQPVAGRDVSIATPFVTYDTLTREFYGNKRDRDFLKEILNNGRRLRFSGV